MANFFLCEYKQPSQQFYYMNTLRRKKLQAYVSSNYTITYNREYSTARRKAFVENRREVRRGAKNAYYNTNPNER